MPPVDFLTEEVDQESVIKVYAVCIEDKLKRALSNKTAAVDRCVLSACERESSRFLAIISISKSFLSMAKLAMINIISEKSS